MMAIAKPRKIIRDAKAWIRHKLAPPSSKVPGQMNYPVLPKLRKRKTKKLES